MSVLLENNMACLKEFFPHVYKVVDEFYKTKAQRHIQTSIEQTKNGLLNVKVHNNSMNVFLHSNYSPENEANALIKTQLQEHHDTFVVLGFGLGYHVDKLVSTFPKKNKLIIEPDLELFTFVIENKDITPTLQNKNLEILVVDSVVQATHELIALYQLGHITSLEFMALPSYQRLYRQFWEELILQYTKFLRTFTVNVRTAMVFKNAWFVNFFRNLKQIPKSADLFDFAGKFKSIPAIIVSAGPSLGRNIDLLKEVGDKALIIAAGSSISALQKAGIKPHVMLGIDGGYEMSEIYDQVKWRDVYFAYVLNLHHKCLDNYPGPKIYTKSSAEHQVDWMERTMKHVTPVLTSGGSCANVCLDFIKKLNCNPVIFMGQDLAFTNMQTHADGCDDNKKVDEKNYDLTKLKKVKDIYGQDIYTADIFQTMGYTFEAYISCLSKDHIFINATEGGININGAQNMTLRDALDEYCVQDVKVTEKLKTLHHSSKGENEKLNKEIIKFVEMVTKNSGKISELSSKRLKLINKIQKNIENNKLGVVTKQRKNLFELTKKIENNILYKEILGPACQDIILVYKNNSEAEAEQVEKLKDKLKLLYEGLLKQYLEIEEKNTVIKIAVKESLKRLKNEE